MTRRIFTVTIAFESPTEPMPPACLVENLLRRSTALDVLIDGTGCQAFISVDQTDEFDAEADWPQFRARTTEGSQR